jgi:hypothetical protein
MSDVLTVTLPDSARPTAPTAGRARLRVDRTSLTTVAMLGLCVLAGAVLLHERAPASDDGAGFVPVIALIGIAIAVARWHPRSGEIPVRGIAPTVATAIGGAAALLLVGLVVAPGHGGGPGLAAGISITLGLAGGYLLCWGYRSIALLRTVVLLSLLTWPPVGDLTHVIVRSSLQQPSDLIYRRLAQFQLFGVRDEPWRLFTASLHRGSLVVIATLVLAIAASRWRVSARVLLDLALTAVAALVFHHVVVMLSPIDNYEPTSAGRLATDPGIEIALAVGAVSALGLVRSRRRTRDRTPDAEVAGTAVRHEHRDPVIFSSNGSVQRRSTTALVACGVVPLVVGLFI